MRITVPNDKTAIILSSHEAQDLYNMCRLLRKQGTRALRENANAFHEIAGVVMLAFVEAKDA